MSEEIGPQTKAAIRKMGGSQSDFDWGKKSLLTFPIGLVLIFTALLLVYASLGFRVRGWDGLLMIFPVIIGVPVMILVGLILAIIGYKRDANRQPATYGLYFWLILAILIALRLLA